MHTNENYKNRHDIPSNVRVRPVQTKEGTNDKAHRAVPFPLFKCIPSQSEGSISASTSNVVSVDLCG